MKRLLACFWPSASRLSVPEMHLSYGWLLACCHYQHHRKHQTCHLTVLSKAADPIQIHIKLEDTALYK
jgi:hypothetical protein